MGGVRRGATRGQGSVQEGRGKPMTGVWQPHLEPSRVASPWTVQVVPQQRRHAHAVRHPVVPCVQDVVHAGANVGFEVVLPHVLAGWGCTRSITGGGDKRGAGEKRLEPRDVAAGEDAARPC
jgi:hypothetical protein